MNSFLLVFAVLTLTTQSQGEYFNNKPQNALPVTYASADKNAVHLGTQIIKGNNGKNYEVTMSESRNVYEKHDPPREQVYIVQLIKQPAIGKTAFQSQRPLRTEFHRNVQQPFGRQQQNVGLNYNQHNRNFAANNAQNHYKQFIVKSYYQPKQQRVYRQQQQQQPHGQATTILPRAQQQQQQQQFYPSNNNLPNSKNLLNDLVNNHKYVSQSEASQLDVYPFTQINGNPRPFTRIITICDRTGRCQTQNAAAYGGRVGGDFYHQQLLKLSKTVIEPSADKFQIKFTGNELKNDDDEVIQKALPVNKDDDFKNRRLIPYCEKEIPKYPSN